MEADDEGQRKMSPADRTGNRTRIISEETRLQACGHIPRQSLAARASETIESSRDKAKCSLTIAKLSTKEAFDEGGDPPCCVLLLFSGLRGPQGHAKLGPSWRGCDRTGAAGASPIGPGPTERDPGPGRDSTWYPLNALGPSEPGPTEPKLKPPARVVTAGSYQI